MVIKNFSWEVISVEMLARLRKPGISSSHQNWNFLAMFLIKKEKPTGITVYQGVGTETGVKICFMVLEIHFDHFARGLDFLPFTRSGPFIQNEFKFEQ